MGTTYNPAIVTDGLVFCVDAANQRSYPKSGTTWSDLVGSETGTLNNMSFASNFTDDNRGEFIFDGSSDYVQLSNNILNGLSLDGGITFSAWINSASPNNQNFIFGVWRQSSSTDQAALFIFNSGPYFAVADGSSSETGGGASNTISAGTWHYITGTWETNRSIKLYTDGVLSGTATQTGNGYNSNSSGSNFYIGAQVQSSFRYFDGEIACLQLYSRALTADEVRQNYEATVGRYT